MFAGRKTVAQYCMLTGILRSGEAQMTKTKTVLKKRRRGQSFTTLLFTVQCTFLYCPDLTISGGWEEICAGLRLQPDGLIDWVSVAVLDGGHLNRLASFSCVPVGWGKDRHQVIQWHTHLYLVMGTYRAFTRLLCCLRQTCSGEEWVLCYEVQWVLLFHKNSYIHIIIP